MRARIPIRVAGMRAHERQEDASHLVATLTGDLNSEILALEGRADWLAAAQTSVTARALAVECRRRVP